MNNIEDKYPTLITLKGLGLPEASFGKDKKNKGKIFYLNISYASLCFLISSLTNSLTLGRFITFPEELVNCLCSLSLLSLLTLLNLFTLYIIYLFLNYTLKGFRVY